MVFVVEYKEALRYDGSNGAYICGTWADIQLLDEDDNGLLTLQNDYDQMLIKEGDWLIKWAPYPNWVWKYSDTEYHNRFREIA